ncbi:hypothetical protein LPA44_15020 [Halobacterium sp. KA-4]|uniref:enolase C-terminal domain-like protein n=1 Tax=Halobacterium sp. KA-4 TaxID=2896367 RepID=UPI001E5DACA2|nr:enolase C-terminal domain-like protein [Halobacterium sp. KA-4]MCD2201185.1 hypothetical protein [Halobacterium sp. KA-4]
MALAEQVYEHLWTRSSTTCSLLKLTQLDSAQPDVSHAGGITDVIKIASMVDAYDIALAPHSPLGPISLAASLHIDAVAPNAIVQGQLLYRPEAPNYLQDSSYFEYDSEGYIEFQDAPGLGISPFLMKLKKQKLVTRG